MRFVVEVEGEVYRGDKTSAGVGCRLFKSHKNAEQFYVFILCRIADGGEHQASSGAKVILHNCRLFHTDADDEQTARRKILLRRAALLKSRVTRIHQAPAQVA